MVICSLQNVEISSLLGHFVVVWVWHSLQVALNIAPLLTKSLNLEQRVETAVSGFVSIDLFAALATLKCTKSGLPTGSCFMAGQTAFNLQSVCLAAIVIGVTKSPEMNPWKYGSCRVAELAIEQFFGTLRNQSSTAQLSCRAYWQAGSRDALKVVRELEKQKPAGLGEPPLTDEQQLVKETGFILFFLEIILW